MKLLPLVAVMFLITACGGHQEHPAPATSQTLESRDVASNLVRRIMQVQGASAEALGAEVTAIRLIQAFRGTAPSHIAFKQLSADIASLGAPTIAARLAGVHAGDLSDRELTLRTLEHIGVVPGTVKLAGSHQILVDALEQLFTAYGKGARGQIVLNLVTLLGGLQADPTWGSAARAFLAVTAANDQYARRESHRVDSPSRLGVRTIQANLALKSRALTSYESSKAYAVDAIVSTLGNHPIINAPFHADEPAAWGLGNFLNRDRLSLFTARLRYGRPPSESLQTVLANQENLAEFIFWELVDGEPARPAWKLVSNCLHPTKAVVADFNQDGVSDVFVACSGYDAPPFPGERNQLILSSSTGFRVVEIEGPAAFDGASAADINGDGYPDVVVVHNTVSLVFEGKKPYVYFLINNKDGTFREDYSRVLDADVFKPFFGYSTAVELVDVDRDGHTDLLVGGVDGTQETRPTKILFGRDGVFGERSQVLPPAPVESGVLDFIVKDDVLYVGRQVRYQRNLVQKIHLKGLRSEIVYDSGPLPEGDPKWVHWWIPTDSGLRSWNTNIFDGTVPY